MSKFLVLGHWIFTSFAFHLNGYPLFQSTFGASCCSFVFIIGMNVGFWVVETVGEPVVNLFSLAKRTVHSLSSPTHDLKKALIKLKASESSEEPQIISDILPQCPDSTLNYQPLNPSLREIRLMKLYPSKSKEAISCDLIHMPLEEASKLQCHALSYCWDDPNVPKIPDTYHPAILCNEYRKPVTLNLLLALGRMRQSGCQYVWADQICINQLDNVEKKHQMALMPDIYALASVVFVWLGEDTNTQSAARGIAMARKVAKSTEESQILTSPERFLQMTSEACAAYGIPNITELSDYLEMMNLIRRPWFRRSWVVQEVALRPRRAVANCGKTEIPFWDLARALTCGLQIGIPSQASEEEALAFAAMMRASAAIHSTWLRPSSALRDVLSQHQFCMAKDPKDKVNAFLSLADDASTDEKEKMVLRADCNPLVSVREWYKEVAITMFEFYPDLDLLGVLSSAECGREETKAFGLDNLPSWVPNWFASTSKSVSFTCQGMYGEPFGDYSASKESEVEVEIGTNNDHLGLSGIFLDTVTEVSKPFTNEILSGQDTIKAVAHYRSLEKMCRIKEPYVTGESGLDAYCGTLTTGGEEYLSKVEQWIDQLATEKPEREVNSDSWSSQYVFHLATLENSAMARRLRISMIRFPLLYLLVTATVSMLRSLLAMLRGQDMAMNRSDAFLRRLTISTRNRKMIRTKGRYLGLAPAGAKEGDMIAVLKGSRVPLILRPCGSMYRVVGDAYVRGIMKGEAFEESQCRKIWLC